MDAQHRDRIEELYFEMYDKLMTYARSSMDNESLAEEAVHETFHIACQKPESLCSSPNPQGWLVLTLKNTIQNMKRNRATAYRIIERNVLEQAKKFAVQEDIISLDIEYGNLAKTEEFKLLYEMAVEGKSHAEMAQKRGITVNACKKRVQRAKEYLRVMIEI